MADAGTKTPFFVSLGMFIIDQFSYKDENGKSTGRALPPQIGGGGTYATIGARIWLTPDKLGMIIDRGEDLPANMLSKLMGYGEQMWLFRNRIDGKTTRALNSYFGDHRNFEYLTPRIRLTPRDLAETRLAWPKALHFVCSPTRALAIMSEVREVEGWSPISIFEPIPDKCIPAELPSLIRVLPDISILSPNAEEALSLLSLPLPPSKDTIETAADKFLSYGVGHEGSGWVVIRSGAMGAYVKSRELTGIWIEAFWTPDDSESGKVVDVTGAGNGFLGGLAAGLLLTKQNMIEATLYASVSASFIIEQEGLPVLSPEGTWNNDSPQRRLEVLRKRIGC
ncbi:hypothetical protein AX17_001061 [Amanita inopinata Kibby_2008]|nr:hypothetical protein AX17_001061 [Amanita inopinata Kibby_2008]